MAGLTDTLTEVAADSRTSFARATPRSATGSGCTTSRRATAR